MRRWPLFLACGWLLAVVGAASAVENPEYVSWAKYKIGTSTTMVLTVEGEIGKTETKYTLIEITPDKCVIEITGRMETDGKVFDLPKQTTDVPHNIAPSQLPGARDVGNSKTSDVDVTVGAGKFKAKLTETTFDGGGNKTITKIWTTEDVPGRTLRIEGIIDGAMKSHTISELAKIEKK